jgi:hypothetical protein
MAVESDDRLAASEAVMALAGVDGAAAMPKCLRHSFGVGAFEADIPPHLVQRWLGHASLRDDGDLRGCDRPGGTAVCQSDVVKKPIETAFEL